MNLITVGYVILSFLKRIGWRLIATMFGIGIKNREKKENQDFVLVSTGSGSFPMQ